MTIEEYARKILADHNCGIYTYGGEWSKHILSDLKEGYPDGMEFPYVDVANAILTISRAKPIVRAPYRMVFDTDDYCDGIDCDSEGEAQALAEDTLVEWMVQERDTWKDPFNPTEDELDRYNYMIYNCSCSVYKYDPDDDEYYETDYPTYETEEEIGWKELTMEDIKKEKEDYESWQTH